MNCSQRVDLPMTPPLDLPALDGTNPLGFFAALGCLTVLDRRARERAAPAPRLGWTQSGRWCPRVVGPADLDELLDALATSAADWAASPIINFAYDDQGQVVPPETPKAVRDLKPPPPAMRRLFANVAGRQELFADASELLCSLATETGVDNNGNIKPTAFHFTSGQQTFLDMVAKLRDGLRRDDLAEALMGPWTRTSELPTLKWDASASREYALRATNPAGKGERPRGVPGADWLAFLGLPFFPVVASGPAGSRVKTTGVEYEEHHFHFSWPLWEAPLSRAAIRSLLGHWKPDAWSPEDRRERGVTAAFRSRIVRAQKGYGSFSPAKPV